jgi:hypothetical protein
MVSVDTTIVAPQPEAVRNDSPTWKVRLNLSLYFSGRLLLGAVFGMSAILHLQNPYFFLISIFEYKLVPTYIAVTLAVLLPNLQLILAVCLLSGMWLRESAIFTAVVLAAFTVAQLVALGLGLDIGCGCFGGTEKVGFWTVSRNVFLIATALFVWRMTVTSNFTNTSGPVHE